MTENTSILARLCRSIEEFFQAPAGTIDGDTVADDVNGWDSLTHTVLMIQLEKMFRVQFTIDEMLDFGCVADISKSISQHVAAHA